MPGRPAHFHPLLLIILLMYIKKIENEINLCACSRRTHAQRRTHFTHHSLIPNIPPPASPSTIIRALSPTTPALAPKAKTP